MPPQFGGFWRKCHQRRNVAEYEGHLEVSDQLLLELIDRLKYWQNKPDCWRQLKNRYRQKHMPTIPLIPTIAAMQDRWRKRSSFTLLESGFH